jgi:hypothetical protein
VWGPARTKKFFIELEEGGGGLKSIKKAFIFSVKKVTLDDLSSELVEGKGFHEKTNFMAFLKISGQKLAQY